MVTKYTDQPFVHNTHTQKKKSALNRNTKRKESENSQEEFFDMVSGADDAFSETPKQSRMDLKKPPTFRCPFSTVAAEEVENGLAVGSHLSGVAVEVDALLLPPPPPPFTPPDKFRRWSEESGSHLSGVSVEVEALLLPPPPSEESDAIAEKFFVYRSLENCV